MTIICNFILFNKKDDHVIRSHFNTIKLLMERVCLFLVHTMIKLWHEFKNRSSHFISVI